LSHNIRTYTLKRSFRNAGHLHALTGDSLKKTVHNCITRTKIGNLFRPKTVRSSAGQSFT